MSAKGTTWKTHKYIKKVNNRYYYTERALSKKVSEFDKKISEKVEKFDDKIQNAHVTIDYINFKIPNIKIDKNNLTNGLKSFKRIYNKYMDVSFEIGKAINYIIKTK